MQYFKIFICLDFILIDQNVPSIEVLYKCSLAHSQIILEYTIIRFYKNLWSSCSLNASVIKNGTYQIQSHSEIHVNLKSAFHSNFYADYIIPNEKNWLESNASGNFFSGFSLRMYII